MRIQLSVQRSTCRLQRTPLGMCLHGGPLSGPCMLVVGTARMVESTCRRDAVRCPVLSCRRGTPLAAYIPRPPPRLGRGPTDTHRSAMACVGRALHACMRAGVVTQPQGRGVQAQPDRHRLHDQRHRVQLPLCQGAHARRPPPAGWHAWAGKGCMQGRSAASATRCLAPQGAVCALCPVRIASYGPPSPPSYGPPPSPPPPAILVLRTTCTRPAGADAPDLLERISQPEESFGSCL